VSPSPPKNPENISFEPRSGYQKKTENEQNPVLKTELASMTNISYIKSPQTKSKYLRKSVHFLKQLTGPAWSVCPLK
jgi:hypothetical protein